MEALIFVVALVLIAAMCIEYLVIMRLISMIERQNMELRRMRSFHEKVLYGLTKDLEAMKKEKSSGKVIDIPKCVNRR